MSFRSGISSFLLAFLLVAACTEQISLGESNPEAGVQLEIADAGASDVLVSDFEQQCTEPLDIVFSIDVSTSMNEEIASVYRGIEEIWDAANRLSANAQFGLIVFVDDVVAVDSCGWFAGFAGFRRALLEWSTEAADNEQLRSTTADGRPLTNTSCEENSLDALHEVAVACQWRADSTRIVVHVTDDTFHAPPGGLPPTLHSYQDVLNALVREEVRVAAFASELNPTACSASRGNEEILPRGFFTEFDGMPSLPSATGGEAFRIFDVRTATVDMASAIVDFVEREYCTPFLE